MYRRSLLLLSFLIISCLFFVGVGSNSNLLIQEIGVQQGLAQSEAQVESLTVSLLPQFNDRRLLIIYEAQLDQVGTAVLAIPSAVELHRASYQSDEGELVEIKAEFEAASDGRFIRFTSPNKTARLELYQDVIPRTTARFVDFTLPDQRYDLQALNWIATFPLDSSDLKSDPPMTLLGENHFGMQEYRRNAGPLPAGQDAKQTIEWVRISEEPSFTFTNEEENILANDDDLMPLYIGLGALFFVGLVMALHGAWQLRQQKQDDVL